MIQPFKIAVPEEVLTDLRDRHVFVLPALVRTMLERGMLG